jgi:protein-S-isoprenylcysteine O-methyltransferase Ste14
MQAIGARFEDPVDPVRIFFQLLEGGAEMHGKDGEHPHGDIGQLILLSLFLVVWVGDSFSLRVSTFLSDIVSVYIRLGLLSLALIIAAYLARSGHVVVNPGGRATGVVSTGAFRYVRHPLYLASILTCLGLAVATASLLSLALSAGIAFFYNYIAGYEEEALLAKYGEEYSMYRERTGKWLPVIRKTVGYTETRK